MFIAQLGKAVISRDEEIETTDVVVFIIRWTMRWYRLGIVIPLQLDWVIQVLPSTDGTKVNLLLVKLGWSATKERMGLALPVALAVTVVEGYVADAGPAVLDDGVRGKLGHVIMALVLYYKVTKNLRSSSESVRFWSDAGVWRVCKRP